MQTVEFDGVEAVTEGLTRMLKAFPEKRRALLEDIGGGMLETVQRNIGGEGKVQSWQDVFMGSKLGYAAVRAKAKKYVTTKGGKQYAVGYITNAIENGHKIRGISGNAKRAYRARKGREFTYHKVAGKKMYRRSEPFIPGIVKNQAEQMLQELAKEMEH